MMAIRGMLRQATAKFRFGGAEKIKGGPEITEHDRDDVVPSQEVGMAGFSNTAALSNFSPTSNKREGADASDRATDDRGSRKHHKEGSSGSSGDCNCSDNSQGAVKQDERKEKPAARPRSAQPDTARELQPIISDTRKSDDDRAPTRASSSRSVTAKILRGDNPLRKLTRFFGLNRGSISAAPPEWKLYQELSKRLNYLPRGQGRCFAELYELGDVLGAGGFAEVKSGIYKPTMEDCAVKVIHRANVLDIHALEHEVAILMKLDHPQIVRFHDFYEERLTYYLVLEKVGGGELFDRIASAGRFNEGDAKGCVRSLLQAVAYCHSQQVAHRDIKPENLLMASPDESDRTIKLADFGLARSVAEGLVEGNPCGTPSYMAPEALRLEPHGMPVDCWGVGVVMYILLGGYAPFASSKTDKLFQLIKRGRVHFDQSSWDAVSVEAKQLILALLTADQKKRLTADQALQHRWLEEPVGGSSGDNTNLGESMVKLQLFNAKLKFRACINAYVACQQLRSVIEGSTVNTTGSSKVPPSGLWPGTGSAELSTHNSPGSSTERLHGGVSCSASQSESVGAGGVDENRRGTASMSDRNSFQQSGLKENDVVCPAMQICKHHTKFNITDNRSRRASGVTRKSTGVLGNSPSGSKMSVPANDRRQLRETFVRKISERRDEEVIGCGDDTSESAGSSAGHR